MHISELKELNDKASTVKDIDGVLEHLCGYDVTKKGTVVMIVLQGVDDDSGEYAIPIPVPEQDRAEYVKRMIEFSRAHQQQLVDELRAAGIQVSLQ